MRGYIGPSSSRHVLTPSATLPDFSDCEGITTLERPLINPFARIGESFIITGVFIEALLSSSFHRLAAIYPKDLAFRSFSAMISVEIYRPFYCFAFVHHPTIILLAIRTFLPLRFSTVHSRMSPSFSSNASMIGLGTVILSDLLFEWALWRTALALNLRLDILLLALGLAL